MGIGQAGRMTYEGSSVPAVHVPSITETAKKPAETPAIVPSSLSSSSLLSPTVELPDKPSAPATVLRASSPPTQEIEISSTSEADEDFWMTMSSDNERETEEQPLEPVPSTSTAPEPDPGPMISKPTHPPNPAPRAKTGVHSPAFCALRSEVPILGPVYSPKAEEERRRRQAAMRRRTVKPTFSQIATMIADGRESTDRLSEMLSARFSLSDVERRKYRKIMRAMRVAQRHLMTRIRRAYPLGCGPEEQQSFLNWLQDQAAEIEERSSDDTDQQQSANKI